MLQGIEALPCEVEVDFAAASSPLSSPLSSSEAGVRLPAVTTALELPASAGTAVGA